MLHRAGGHCLGHFCIYFYLKKAICYPQMIDALQQMHGLNSGSKESRTRSL
jgi:hypothetical protein